MSPTVLLLLSLTAAPSEAAVDFDTQIVPLMTKAGCNTGACHGAAVGRGGFKLSLYGSNPSADFAAMTQQWEGRRVNLSRPDRSLLIRKPTADMDHGGDQRFQHDSESAELLLSWVRAGAARRQTRELAELTVSPTVHVAQQVEQTVNLAVTATFSDGHVADVTRWTVIKPEDEAAVTLNESGTVATIHRRGSHLLTARYLDRVLPIRLIVPLTDQPVNNSSDPPRGFIDRLVSEQLTTLRLPVAPSADDATFLRRVMLDLTGRLPAPDRVQSFLDDPSPDRRTHLIDELLASDEFVTYWTFQLAKLLRVRPVGNDVVTAETYHDWLRERIAEQTPYDEMARALLLATGDSHEVGPANFHRVVGGPREQAEFVSQLFMGARLRCANCHDHPLDVWTQDDYHGLSAIFARMQRGRVVAVGDRGEVSHPRTQTAAVPKIPGDRFLSPEGDVRPELSNWLTSPENPHFARAIVNRLWRQLMGRGLVEPVDDLRTTNPGTHPELLKQLAEDFAAGGYDLRQTIRRIATSAAYQRSSQPASGSEADDRYYSHYLSEPLEPEVFADAVADATGVPFSYDNASAGERAVALVDPKSTASTLGVLGVCDREDSCESPTSVGGVAVKLHLLNGPFLNHAVSAENGHLSGRLSDGSSDQAIIDELYLRTLSRSPRSTEQNYWQQQIADVADADRRAFWEDVLWSLLTSREFTTNH